MTSSDDNLQRTGPHHWEKVLYRFIPTVISIYVFYKLIIMQAGIFLDVRLFIMTWITLFLTTAGAMVFAGHVLLARRAASYWGSLLVRWPLLAAALGFVSFHLGPHFFPFFLLL